MRSNINGNIDLVSARSSIQNGGLITALHVQNLYDTFISGSDTTNDLNMFGEMIVSNGKISNTKNDMQYPGLAIGIGCIVSSSNSFVHGNGASSKLPYQQAFANNFLNSTFTSQNSQIILLQKTGDEEFYITEDTQGMLLLTDTSYLFNILVFGKSSLTPGELCAIQVYAYATYTKLWVIEQSKTQLLSLLNVSVELSMSDNTLHIVATDGTFNSIAYVNYIEIT